MSQTIEERIARLEAFKGLLREWDNHPSQDAREKINQEKRWAHREVAQLGCLKLITISPPPAVGGMVMQNVDMFNHLFEQIYLRSPLPIVIDMIDEAIGRLKSGDLPEAPRNEATITAQIREGYAFVVMKIDPDDHALDDVLDAIKEAGLRCGVTAERIDEAEANERITDRILESIRRAQFVIVDVTHPRPNVYYEAGFAQGIGKLPIYIARSGTRLEFDLKDYPTIFFNNMRELKDGLEKRLRAIAEQAKR